MAGKFTDATCGRLFAALYDRISRHEEEAGMGDARRELLASAEGRTLELGAGTGLNLGHYPDGVTELVLLEPDPYMGAKLQQTVAGAGRRARIVQASAEALPFEDASFDTAVATLVLCTVPQVDAALSELARVLGPGGRFLFLEHVRAEGAREARWQDRVERPWGFFARGCHPNRDTAATIEASALQVERLERYRADYAPPLARERISGSAVSR